MSRSIGRGILVAAFRRSRAARRPRGRPSHRERVRRRNRHPRRRRLTRAHHGSASAAGARTPGTAAQPRGDPSARRRRAGRSWTPACSPSCAGRPLHPTVAQDDPCRRGDLRPRSARIAYLDYAPPEAARVASAYRRADCHPLRVRVDVEAVAAQEADQRHAEALGGLDGEVGRGGDRGEDRDAGDRRLLDQLEARPAGHEHDPVVERQRAGRAAGCRRACRARCGGRRPRAARPGRRSASNSPAAWSPPVASNTRLGLAQADRQADQRRPRHDRAGRDRVAANLDLVERRLAADPARRRGDEVPLRDPRRVERRRQVDGDLVVGLGVGGRDRRA